MFWDGLNSCQLHNIKIEWIIPSIRYWTTAVQYKTRIRNNEVQKCCQPKFSLLSLFPPFYNVSYYRMYLILWLVSVVSYAPQWMWPRKLCNRPFRPWGQPSDPEERVRNVCSLNVYFVSCSKKKTKKPHLLHSRCHFLLRKCCGLCCGYNRSCR